MIYVNLRDGNDGCGVVGSSLTAALAALTSVRRVGRGTGAPQILDGPLLERIYRFERTYTASRYVAYNVFEDDLRMRRVGIKARDLFDVVVPASHWCEQALRDAGLTAVTTIHQGVDGTLFNPALAIRRRFRDRFVVFSGGKLELRKGQDIVLQAFRAFAERHADAFLVAAWLQPWTSHSATLMASPHTPFSLLPGKAPAELVLRWLVSTGVDPDRVELVPPLPHADLAAIYGETDVGLFPSRCEGGTNLVMMEYMACGRPVVATDFSGHRDILTQANSIRLRASKPLIIHRYGEASAMWCEPDIDEVVECLERAYDDRSRLESVGRQAAIDLSDWTWERAARRFLQLLEGGVAHA